MKRRVAWFRARSLAAIVIAGALVAGCASTSGPSDPSTGVGPTRGSATTTTTTGVGTTAPAGTTAPRSRGHRHARSTRIDDGSLGNQATRMACTLLSRDEIRAQFGGAVGVPTPTYPYCQWLVGTSAFLGLAVEPGVPFRTATEYVSSLEAVKGVGQAAMIGNNRFLYFSAAGTSYWLLWQQVGDFSELHTAQLTALAHDVLAHRLPSSRIGIPPPPQAGPPIYFAGDSTAAGPEWAWVTDHTASRARKTLAEYQVGSGLIVPSFFDWARHVLAVVAERRPKLVIYMGSANDGQALLVNGAIAQVGSPAWRTAYGQRVGSMMASLVAEGTKVLWIGEPAMQSGSLSADMAVVDQVVEEQAARHRGVTFFDPGQVLNGPHGSYRPTVVIGGVPTTVRLDGIHLNIAGSLYLAGFIARYVDGILRLR
jgi:hypothetical protein